MSFFGGGAVVQATTIGGHHATTLNPASAGQTYYFGYPHDLGAITFSSVGERGFRFPYAGKVIAANLTIYVGGTVATGPGPGAAVGIYNKATTTFSSFGFASLSWGSAWQAFASSELSIDVNAADSYAFSVIVPQHTVPPTAVRHYCNLFFVRL